MKVLLINNCHYRKGGSEAVYFNTAKVLREQGHEVVFFSYAHERNVKTGDNEYFLNPGSSLKTILRYFYNRDAAKMLDIILDKEKPDIAHSHLMWGGINQAIFRVLKKHKVPLVHTAHDYRMVCPAYAFRDGSGKVCERCSRWNYYQCAFHRCSKGSMVMSTLMAAEMYERQLFFNPLEHINGFLFVSEFSLQKHIEHCKGFSRAKHKVLYNYTHPEKQPLTAKEKSDYFLYFGRLSYEKGIPTLLKVFARHPELKLMVVGTGPLEEELRREYCASEEYTANRCDERAVKCYENITFLGYHSGGTLANLVRSARFVCVPSEWYENNPMTIVEAYSLGTPVIGSRIGGIPEIIEEGNTGFLFHSGNVNDLEKVVVKANSITPDEYAKLCANAFRFHEQNFSEKEYGKKLMTFYESVIADYHRSESSGNN